MKNSIFNKNDNVIWETYLGTLGTLENKYITNADLKFLNMISFQKENNNFNKDLNIFAQIIQTLSNFYINLHGNKIEEKNIENINKIIEKESNEKINLNIDNNNIKKINKENEIKNNNSNKNVNINKINIINEQEKNFSTCIFCVEDFDESEVTNPLLDCAKHIHGKCLSNYIEHELNNNKFPIKCPLCTGPYTHEINYKTLHDCLILNDKEKLVIKK